MPERAKCIKPLLNWTRGSRTLRYRSGRSKSWLKIKNTKCPTTASLCSEYGDFGPHRQLSERGRYHPRRRVEAPRLLCTPI